MGPRRKNLSHKFRKAQLKDAKAVKRGEITVEEAAAAHLDRRSTRIPTPQIARNTLTPNAATHESIVKGKRKLQSRFTGLSEEYLDKTRDLAFSVKLPRPLPGSSAVFPLELLTERDKERRLSCPVRPRFRAGQTKKEVERNEEGIFTRWLNITNGVIREWIDEDVIKVDERDIGDVPVVEEEEDLPPKWPRGPTWFETNLEVWRQLWRVTETSSIILLLLDARCPPLHSPPSLKAYLQNLKPRKEIILVLTKSDLVDHEALVGWKEWVKEWWGQEGIQVVSVMSYEVDLLNAGSGKTKHKPDIPQASLDELLTAVRIAHERLLRPPEEQEKSEWRPSVRRTVDWSLLARHADFPLSSHQQDSTDQPSSTGSEFKPISAGDRHILIGSMPGKTMRDPEKEPLTIGLVGQPNVGKSSLLNALLGEQRVRASRTPGKTKHFQTMFWGWKKEVKIVDCPGLVCPSLVGVELQVLAGILPISQIPSLPACISFAAQHLPLEMIFRIPQPPPSEEDSYDLKKTYRDPERAKEIARVKAESWGWTAGGLMEGRAADCGFVTAKGGRLDTNRAANGMMRQLADGKIRWGFWPPGSDVSSRETVGIWLGRSYAVDDDHARGGDEGGWSKSDEESFEEDFSDSEEDDDGKSEEVDQAEDEEDEDDFAKINVRGFFAALASRDEGAETSEDGVEGSKDDELAV